MISKEQAKAACTEAVADILANREELFDSPSFWLAAIDMCKAKIARLPEVDSGAVASPSADAGKPFTEQDRLYAERYRWLRDCSDIRSDRTITILQHLYEAGKFVGSASPSREDLDTIVDEHRSRK